MREGAVVSMVGILLIKAEGTSVEKLVLKPSMVVPWAGPIIRFLGEGFSLKLIKVPPSNFYWTGGEIKPWKTFVCCPKKVLFSTEIWMGTLEASMQDLKSSPAQFGSSRCNLPLRATRPPAVTLRTTRNVKRTNGNSIAASRLVASLQFIFIFLGVFQCRGLGQGISRKTYLAWLAL